MKKSSKTERKQARMQKLQQVIESSEALILVESVEDAHFIKGLIKNRYNQNNIGVLYVYEAGSRSEVYSDLKIIRTLLTAPSVIVKRILCLIDGDDQDSTQAYQEQFDQIQDKALKKNCFLHHFQSNESNGYRDFETLAMSITKPEYQKINVLKDAFIQGAETQGLDMSKKKSKREIGVWMTAFPTYDGYMDKVLFNDITDYLDLDHRNLAPLYAILDPYFERA
ncbi:MAG: hypothetical protein HEQ32_09165 [Vampirovibrio sp.]